MVTLPFLYRDDLVYRPLRMSPELWMIAVKYLRGLYLTIPGQSILEHALGIHTCNSRTKISQSEL